MSNEWNSKDPREESQESSAEERSFKDGELNSDGLNAGRWTDEEHDKFLEAL